VSGQPPLVAHVIYRLAVGGLENGLVNLINRMPADRYRHAIVCIDDYTDFRRRIQRDDVTVHALHKRPGHDPGVYWRAWRLFRRLRPAIVHTRNLAALEFQLSAFLAGVPGRVQGEHGRDSNDLHGTNRKYLRLRRLLNPLVKRHVALSRDLQQWLEQAVGVPARDIRQIYNGVDSQRFLPVPARRPLPTPEPFPADAVVIGTVGRMQGEKDQLTLTRAFIRLVRGRGGEEGARLRLVLIGDGPLREPAAALLAEAGLAGQAWLPGQRDDAPALMQGLDVFVLPSLVEGVSNTILEAMASGLPVVATEVGGNAELVVAGETGRLVPSADAEAMAAAMGAYVESPALRRAHGEAGRARVEASFSMQRMVAGYLSLYDELLTGAAPSDFKERE